MKSKFWRFLLLIITILFIGFLYVSRGEVASIFSVISQSLFRWVAIAILAELAAYYFIVLAHQFSLKIVGIARDKKELIQLVLAALVINTTAPTGGASGTLLFADDAKNKEESPTAAATGILLLIICYYIGLLTILSIILLYLRLRGELGLTEVFSTLFLLLVTGIFVSLIVLAKRKPQSVHNFMEWLNNIIYRLKRIFTKKALLSKTWPGMVSEELQNASESIHDNLQEVIKVIALQFATHFFNIIALFFIFLSFGIMTKFGIIIVGYAIGELFKTVSPAPEGVGVTEASMAVIYISFGIDPVDATAISLVYRALNFWIPLAIGFIILHVRHLQPEEFKKRVNEENSID